MQSESGYVNPDEGKQYTCTSCREVKPGRFTKAILDPNGWSQHRNKCLLWYCWSCLPFGKGLRPRES